MDTTETTDNARRHSLSSMDVLEPDSASSPLPQRPVLLRLYLSHTLSTWNARTFEFGAVIFLAAIFPGTLFFASCYALFRSAAATLLSSWIGAKVDQTNRLKTVRQSIIWQRIPVALSCLILLYLLNVEQENSLVLLCFSVSIGLACVEKLASIANTVAVERDWLVVIADSLGSDRQRLNSTMRRIDLICKLVAPLFISLIDGYSTSIAIWTVFGQNALSVLFEFFAIKQVHDAIPELEARLGPSVDESEGAESAAHCTDMIFTFWKPWKAYAKNSAFLASFSLSLLYLTVLSTGSQMATYLLTLGFTSVHVSIIRLVAVIFEVSATCAAPILMNRIGPVRSGLWFINEQLISVAAAVGLFLSLNEGTRLGGAMLIAGVTLSRLGLWGFDLSVQYLVQEDTPEATRGRFSAVEMALQNLFELLSFASTMIFHRPQDFRYPVLISLGSTGLSAICFAGFVRQRRGHLLHASKCLKRTKYTAVPQQELNQLPS